MKKKKPLNHKPNRNKQYNCVFGMAKFMASLKAYHKTSPGTNKIMYTIVKHLHPNAQMVLLSLYNKIWTAGCIHLA